MILKATLIILLAINFQAFCQPPGFNFSKPFEHKYVQGAVFLSNPNKNCSGTIIHEWWVLTAAQCVRGVDGDIRLFAGAERISGRLLNSTRDPPMRMQARLADEVLPHPKYQEGKLSKYDLALIRVNMPFDLNERVTVVELSAEEWPTRTDFVRHCVSWGYGNLFPGNAERFDVYIKSWNSSAVHNIQPGFCRCTERFQRRRMVCLKHADGIALCDGDAGASLLCPVASGDGELAIFGVAHMTAYKHLCGFERATGAGCPKLPVDNDYMYTCPFNDWVAFHVPGVAHRPLSCGAGATATATALLVAALSCVIV